MTICATFSSKLSTCSIRVRLSFERFAADETLRRAFVRSLEVIGEAVKNLPEDFRASHSEVDWRPIARMRDRLIHRYFGVDYQLVWDVVQEKLPELKRKIRSIIDNLQQI